MNQTNPKSAPKRTHVADLLSKSMDDAALKLHTFTKINDMPEGEPWDTIKDLYSRTKLRERVMACLINGRVSSRKAQFLLSRRIMEEYLTLDLNIDRRTIKGTEFKNLMDGLLASVQSGGILKCLNEPKLDGRGTGKNLAGTYQFAHPALLSILPQKESTQSSTHQSAQQSTRGLDWHVPGMARAQVETIDLAEDYYASLTDAEIEAFRNEGPTYEELVYYENEYRKLPLSFNSEEIRAIRDADRKDKRRQGGR